MCNPCVWSGIALFTLTLKIESYSYMLLPDTYDIWALIPKLSFLSRVLFDYLRLILLNFYGNGNSSALSPSFDIRLLLFQYSLSSNRLEFLEGIRRRCKVSFCCVRISLAHCGRVYIHCYFQDLYIFKYIIQFTTRLNLYY